MPKPSLKAWLLLSALITALIPVPALSLMWLYGPRIRKSWKRTWQPSGKSPQRSSKRLEQVQKQTGWSGLRYGDGYSTQSRGGYLRPFGCGWFIREFLLGKGPEGSRKIDPAFGAAQSDINYEYKEALARATARERAEKIISRLVLSGADVTEEEAERIYQRELKGSPVNLPICAITPSWFISGCSSVWVGWRLPVLPNLPPFRRTIPQLQTGSITG